jgi:hypothetical protein
VVAGDTGAPVVGAQVLVGGRAYTTAATGEIPLDNPSFAGVPLRVDTSGFLLRETVSPRTVVDGPITLWPIHGAYSDTYVRTLLYKPSDTTRQEPSPMPDQPLMRVVAGHVSIVPSLVLQADAEAMEAHRRAVDVLNEATEGRVVFTLDTVPTGPVFFKMLIDESSKDGAFTYRTLRDDAIVGGRVVFSSREGFHPARDVRYVAHELGHVLGLQHSIVATDMMYYTAHVSSPMAFTADEKLTIKLLLQRQPGNRYPDRDASLQ